MHYYVKKTGCDATGDGSEAKPFLTINHAAAAVAPGDTVIVFPGVYDECVSPTISGKPQAWITFKAHPDFKAKDIAAKYGFGNHEAHGVVIKGTECGVNFTASYIRVEGFFITTHPTSFPPEATNRRHDSCIRMCTSGVKGQPYHHLEASENVIYGGAESGIAGGDIDFVLLKNNIVFQSASAGIWMGSGISLCHFGNPLPGGRDDSGVFGDWHFIVEGNISYCNSNYDIGRRKAEGEEGLPYDTKGNSDGSGIIIDWGFNEPSGRTLLRNNIVYNNGGRGICLTGSSNVVVVNNTLYDNAWCPYYVYGPHPEFTDLQMRNPGTVVGVEGTLMGGDKNVFVNNIVYSASLPKGRVLIDRLRSGVYTDYNCYFNGGYGNNAARSDDSSKYLNVNDTEGIDPKLVNAPPLIAENKRLTRPRDIHPIDIIHWYDTDFSLKNDSPCVNAGYTKDSDFSRAPGMTDEMAAELKHFLDMGLPATDIFGNPRDPKLMDTGAIAFMGVRPAPVAKKAAQAPKAASADMYYLYLYEYPTASQKAYYFTPTGSIGHIETALAELLEAEYLMVEFDQLPAGDDWSLTLSIQRPEDAAPVVTPDMRKYISGKKLTVKLADLNNYNNIKPDDRKVIWTFECKGHDLKDFGLTGYLSKSPQ